MKIERDMLNQKEFDAFVPEVTRKRQTRKWLVVGIGIAVLGMYLYYKHLQVEEETND
ncbi:MAG: hypothetical protein HN686_14420 [Bacteroidetes bacterium]|jgi:hypothetical protein|nr:hypothetical protein [Bacteroidota bacterium]